MEPDRPGVLELEDESAAAAGGKFVMAIPHTRRLFRTKTILRLVALIFSIVYITCISVLDNWTFYLDSVSVHWVTGGPMAFGSIFWNTSDLLALFSRHGGAPWNRHRPRWHKGVQPPSTDTWGHPGFHVTVHLMIWLFAVVGMIVMFVSSRMSSSETEIFLYVARAVIMIIHFILFVLACINADTNSRNASTVIFVPDEGGRACGYAPPSTIWEVVWQRKRDIGYYADHFVRFDGQVQVAGDYVTRPAR